MATPYENDELTEKIIGFAIEVHRHLGPGLLESAYEECLGYELTQNGFKLAVAEGENGDAPIHNTRAVLVDRHGLIRGYYDMLAPDTVTKLLADTSHLLREQPSPR